MQENNFPILRTNRLILRDFKQEDWRDAHEYGSDPVVVKYLPFGPNTEEDTKAFINKAIIKQKARPRLSYDFALVNKSKNKVMGSCGINIIRAENKEGEIGYVLNRNYWNQDYMTEAAQKVLSFGFTQLGLHRIFATCDPANIGSSRVMEKIGMQREGYLRETRLIKGGWRDFLLYSILKKEWQNGKVDSLEKSDIENDGGKVIEYLEKNQNDLDIIRPLWEKLHAHHLAVAKYFKDSRSTITFDMRKKQLLDKSYQGALRIDLARDAITKENIGY
ncbi:MAG: GNAT family protein, partial [Smithella sp.]